MKKITVREFEDIKRSKAWTERTGIIKDILDMKLGEAALIAKDEWTLKGKFQITVHSLARSQFAYTNKKMKFRCKTLPDGTGYAVTRTI